MSKCECCKEKNSDLITYKGYKMCPACYMGYVRKVKVCENNAKYETEIDQLKQQLAEKNIRIEELEGQFAYECECNKQLVELQKQLTEKDKEIHSLIVGYEKRISQEQELMSNLEKQLAEKEEELLKQKEKSARTEQIYNGIIVDKDKEIEKLKQQYTILENENGKLTTELIMDKYKKAKKEVSFGKQLAIQELEKVKMITEWKFNSITDVVDFINQQIKELKGEKDAED